MLKLLRKREYNIGIDMGGSSLKMMQLARGSNGPEIVAAAQVEVPFEIRANKAELQQWYIQNIKAQLSRMPFRGKKVVSTMPSRYLIVQHLRIAKMDPDQLDKALAFEAQDKVPFDINTAMIRYVVAGEIYENNEPKLEVIFMAAPLQAVRRHLYILEKAKLEVEGLRTEPNTIIKCFSPLLEAQETSDKAIMFIDMGHDSTKVIISHGTKMAFSRDIGIAAADIREDIMNTTGVNYDKAMQWHYGYGYIKAKTNDAQGLALTQHGGTIPSANADTAQGDGVASNKELIRINNVENAGQHIATQPAATAVLGQAAEVNVNHDPKVQATTIVERKLQRLAAEIRNCVRYHNLTFEMQPVGKVVFLGGQTKNKKLCQYLAQLLRLPAQIGDPLARIVNMESNTKRHNLFAGQNNSEWAVAYGLSLK